MKKIEIFPSLIIVISLFGCGSRTPVNPQVEYERATRNLNLTPVYPPRSDVRVGDVVLRVMDSDDVRRTYTVGNLKSVERYAVEYGQASRAPYHDNDASPSDQMLSSAPYPAITTSVQVAAALGGGLPGGSGMFNFGRNDRVSINFNDSKSFGPPGGGVGLVTETNFPSEFGGSLCARLGEATALASVARNGDPQPCAGTGRCHFQIPTRVFLTKKISYTYTRGRGFSSGGSVPTSPSSPVNQTVPVIVVNSAQPGAVSAQSTPAPVTTTPAQNGLTISYLSSTEVKLDQNFADYVTIAYESRDYAYEQLAAQCRKDDLL